MGAAYFTVLAFLAPITILICEEAKMDKLTGAVAINCGALAGGNFPTASLGVVFRGLIDTAYEAEPAFEATNSFVDEMKIFGFAIVFSLILIAIFRFGFKSNRIQRYILHFYSSDISQTPQLLLPYYSRDIPL